jgi:transposase
MGNYSVPEEIRKLKPRGTMVKAINGKYYVYEYSCVVRPGGKRATRMGKCIGAIKEGIGFVANGSRLFEEDVTVLEYGQYAIAVANSGNTLSILKEFFNAEDATYIYVMAMIHFANGFCYLKDMEAHYSMSWLSLRYPTLRMGYDNLSRIYDALGRRQGPVLAMEQALSERCSGTLAVDGHVIGSGSWCNDLSEKGYRFESLKECQMNMVMAYDVATLTPVAVRVAEGGSPDKLSVKDLLGDIVFRDKLFLADRGFYSSSNIRLFSQDGNRYIMSVPGNCSDCKDAVADLSYTGIFVYEGNGKLVTVDWKRMDRDDCRVYVFRDKDEAAKKCTNYLLEMNQGKKNYTLEGYGKMKDYFGVYVLRTNDMAMAAEDVFAWYKKRWNIETFYNYFKNDADCSDFHQMDFCKVQGLSFVLMVSAMIHGEVQKAVSKLPSRTSVKDAILHSRMVKINKRDGRWICTNCKKSHRELLEHLGASLTIG